MRSATVCRAGEKAGIITNMVVLPYDGGSILISGASA
jgi:hypothetical protein